MWSAVCFCFVVVVPVCATATITIRWLRSITAIDADLPDADAMRRATRDMSDRLKNLEQMLDGDTPRLAREGS